MSAVVRELLAVCRQASEVLTIPPVRQIYMPEPHPHPDKDSEFGVIVLDDDSCGLYYAWLGESQSGMNERYSMNDLLQMNVLELAQFSLKEHEADRSLGMAAINAISQSVFRQKEIKLDVAGDSMGELQLAEGDHLGMVGYFPSLIRRLRAMAVKITVIEKKSQFVQKDSQLTVTQDVSQLSRCNKILSTASTLINDSVDAILANCVNAETIVMVGPTAGFIPDPLFKRGVNVIGGSFIKNVKLAIDRLSQEQALADAAEKYLIKKSNYREISELLL